MQNLSPKQIELAAENVALFALLVFVLSFFAILPITTPFIKRYAERHKRTDASGPSARDTLRTASEPVSEPQPVQQPQPAPEPQPVPDPRCVSFAPRVEQAAPREPQRPELYVGAYDAQPYAPPSPPFSRAAAKDFDSARNFGALWACRVDNSQPVIHGIPVYVSARGSCYHHYRDCPAICDLSASSVIQVLLEDAQRFERRECSYCMARLLPHTRRSQTKRPRQ